jgi:hypothetical protein
MTDRPHPLGRLPEKELEPLYDGEQRRRRELDDITADITMLDILRKHHPERERDKWSTG